MIVELLKLFWVFFKVGAFTFGGGYAMIPLMEDAVVGTFITQELFTDMIAISESTPGPFAVNMATFVGMNEHGLLGAFFATLGVVLPSFVIILIIAILGTKFIRSKYTKSAFAALRPAAVGLIIVALIGIFFRVIFPGYEIRTFSLKTLLNSFKYKPLIITVIIFALSKIFKRMHPIFLIVIAGILGLLFYGIPVWIN